METEKMDNDGTVEVEPKEQVDVVKTKAHMMDKSAGVLTIDLPCGYLDDDGVLHRSITVREMRGHEEELLAGKGKASERLTKIMDNCTVTLGTLTERSKISEGVHNLTAQDRMAVMIALRRVSLGDMYFVKMECPNSDCKEMSRFNLDLSEIEVLQMRDPMVRNREDTLQSGKVVSWHIMTAEDEAWVSDTARRMKKKKEKDFELTMGMLARVDKVDGVSLVRGDKNGLADALMLLKDLPYRDRVEIRSLFRREEGDVDTTVDFECPVCGHEWSADMETNQAGFFFPSEL